MKITCTARIAIVSVALFALLATGCSREEKAPENTRDTKELRQLGYLYQKYMDSNSKAPASADDLLKITGRDRRSAQVVQAAKSGKYVILWGVAIPKEGAQASSTILGYEKDAPTAGGLVLMGDGNVKNMTTAEFQSAPKATDK
jgi:hypothetical protein